jgi:hypothetical protein
LILFLSPLHRGATNVIAQCIGETDANYFGKPSRRYFGISPRDVQHNDKSFEEIAGGGTLGDREGCDWIQLLESCVCAIVSVPAGRAGAPASIAANGTASSQFLA